ncbi:uncharacterized protein [Rutidosis leptorrhynchoides]|uniref:uncharacterized protein n=1 Tax=Rutidosis leptorrhynchoides TaxID=125765 RepID=UPI003A99E3E9
MSRIDRGLINSHWARLWPEAILQMAQPDRSDNKPIVWGKKLICWGPRPFRFNNSWLSKQGFLDFCEAKWYNYDTVRWAAFILGKKLRLLKSDLKMWKSTQQDPNCNNLKVCVAEIKRLKDWYKIHDLTDHELSELANLKKLKKQVMIRIESKHMLQSCFRWLKLGDKNSKFLHLVSRIRQQSNYIAGM